MTELKREPAMPLYCADWLSGEATTKLPFELEGPFLRLLAYAWLATPECTIPDDDTVLAHVSKMGSKWKTKGGPVKALFQPVDDAPGRLRNSKQWKVWLDRLAFRLKQANNGVKGGRPSAKGDRKQTDTKPRHNPNETDTKPESNLAVAVAFQPLTSFEGERAQAQAAEKDIDWGTVEALMGKIEAAGVKPMPGEQTVVGWYVEFGHELIVETLIDCEQSLRGKGWKYLETTLAGRHANPSERPAARKAAAAARASGGNQRPVAAAPAYAVGVPAELRNLGRKTNA